MGSSTAIKLGTAIDRQLDQYRHGMFLLGDDRLEDHDTLRE